MARQYGFSALSPEVLDKVLEDFYPVKFLNKREWFSFAIEDRFTVLTDNFFRAREFCLGLRLLDKQCNRLVTPHIYSHFVLPLHPEKTFLQRLQATKHQPTLIKELFLQPPDRRDDKFQKKVVNALRPFLVACSNLRNIHIVDAPNVFWNVKKPQVHQLLRGVNSLSSLTLQFVANSRVHTTLGAILTGLAHLAGQLEHLDVEFYIDLSWGGIDKGPITFPDYSFPSLRKLALRNSSSSFSEAILSRINCGGTHPNCTVEAPCVPLRSLTLAARGLDIPTLLKINNLGLTLTSLEIFPRDSSDPHSLPSQVFELCPKLEKFVHYAWFPLSALSCLPEALHVLGLGFDEDGLGQTHVTDAKQLVDFIKDTERRKGLKELYVDVVVEKKKMKELREVCAENGIALRGYWNKGTELYLQFLGPDSLDTSDEGEGYDYYH
ncbi:hypothetical protein BDN72DRAFT_847182 [Pluteus cervinus]|uniref:Uncharacterized protein n=1 Tax=Pluteus cervinus TaxID=181527 RepID=A0ACD3ADT0_9AGAR|nr:hypothetical protein BDN72DRAFT_847182 [Pluteus cervinus]